MVVVGFVEQILLIPAVFALFLVTTSAWWLLVVFLPLTPRLALDLSCRLEVISLDRQATAKETNRALLKAVIIFLAFIGIVGILSEIFE